MQSEDWWPMLVVLERWDGVIQMLPDWADWRVCGSVFIVAIILLHWQGEWMHLANLAESVSRVKIDVVKLA